MARLCHGVAFEDRRAELVFELVEELGRELRRAGADEADFWHPFWCGEAEDESVHCRRGRVPRRFVLGEVVPEGGQKPRWEDDAAARAEGGEEGGEEAVDVEEGHDEHRAVDGREGVGGDDVVDVAYEVFVGQRDGFGLRGCAACVEDEGCVVF